MREALRHGILTFALCAGFLGVSPAAASEPQFDNQLLRLSEVLGSLHFLRNLCGENGDEWRNHMEALIEAEEPDEERRKRLIARFNHGYRSFEANYTRCTEAAIEAIRRYMKEGEELSRDTATRFGN